MKDFTILKWDSGLFGFGVARVEPHRFTQESLERIVLEMRQAGVVLAYCACSPEDTRSNRAAETVGGRLVDSKTTYVLSLTDVEMDTGERPPVEEYSDDVPDDALIALSIQSGEHSRFSVDPRIPRRKFEELYESWIRNSVSKQLADATLVISDAGRSIAMITVKVTDGRGDIGLVAVDSAQRGRGLGATLIAGALQWFRARGCETVSVVTQGDNKAACSLYEKLGFKVESVEMLYHLWI